MTSDLTLTNSPIPSVTSTSRPRINGKLRVIEALPVVSRGFNPALRLILRGGSMDVIPQRENDRGGFEVAKPLN